MKPLLIALAVFVVLILIGVFSKEQTWARRFSVSVDILTFSLFERQYDVTISSWCGWQIRAGAKGNKFGRTLGWVLNHLQANHCEQAIAADLARASGAWQYLMTGG